MNADEGGGTAPRGRSGGPGLYILGFLLLLGGLALAAGMLGVPALWIAAGLIGLIVFGGLAALSRPAPRNRDSGT